MNRIVPDKNRIVPAPPATDNPNPSQDRQHFYRLPPIRSSSNQSAQGTGSPVSPMDTPIMQMLDPYLRSFIRLIHPAEGEIIELQAFFTPQKIEELPEFFQKALRNEKSSFQRCLNLAIFLFLSVFEKSPATLLTLARVEKSLIDLSGTEAEKNSCLITFASIKAQFSYSAEHLREEMDNHTIQELSILASISPQAFGEALSKWFIADFSNQTKQNKLLLLYREGVEVHAVIDQISLSTEFTEHFFLYCLPPYFREDIPLERRTKFAADFFSHDRAKTAFNQFQSSIDPDIVTFIRKAANMPVKRRRSTLRSFSFSSMFKQKKDE